MRESQEQYCSSLDDFPRVKSLEKRLITISVSMSAMKSGRCSSVDHATPVRPSTPNPVTAPPMKQERRLTASVLSLGRHFDRSTEERNRSESWGWN